MATNNSKITREVVATTVQETSRATFNDWNINFTIQKDGDIVKSVHVNGTKGQSSFNASINEQGYANIGFSAGARDNALTAAVLDELDAIKGAS